MDYLKGSCQTEAHSSWRSLHGKSTIWWGSSSLPLWHTTLKETGRWKELEQFLCLFTNQWQDDWDDLLPFAEFQYNNHIHTTTQNIPFLLDMGRIPQMGFELEQLHSRLESVNEFKERMEDTLMEAKAALAKFKDEMAKYYNWRRLPAPDYQPGDKVYLDASDILLHSVSQVNSVSVSVCIAMLPQAYSCFTISSRVHPLRKFGKFPCHSGSSVIILNTIT